MRSGPGLFLLAAAFVFLLAVCDDGSPSPPAPSVATSPITTVPPERVVTIWHRDTDGVIRWGRLAYCRGNVCRPGPTVYPSPGRP